MSYKALYRTYRPSTFDEVAGQKHIVQTLKNALRENKIAHAYLFCGPRGTGKTTMARLFAKALNCEEGFGHQCNHCENCISIANGTHPDVMEIDAASNRGIDDIRALIERVKYAPIRGKYKVYIIDEVHMLTTEAFNALLKTLEEPPSNVVFILATTEPYKLMPTILSRCQRYDFMKVSDIDLMQKLKEICQKEGINAENRALSAIVTLADGGVRDALSMLDQVVAYSGKDLQEKHINEIFGLSSKEEKIELLKAIRSKDVEKISSLNEQYAYKGIDVRRLTLDLLDMLKDLLIYKNTAKSSMAKVLTSDEAKLLPFTYKEINEMIDILLSAVMQYRFVASANSLFEITLLKLASINNAVEGNTTYEIPQEKVMGTSEKINKIEDVNPPKVLSFSDIDELLDQGTQIGFQDDDLLNIMVQATKTERNYITKAWEEMKRVTFDAKANKYYETLMQCFPRIVSKEAIILESTYNSYVFKINAKENQMGFRRILAYFIGREYLIICLPHNLYLEKTNKFKELLQANKLPAPRPININEFFNK